MLGCAAAHTAADLDRAVNEIAAAMKGDRAKSPVAFYYLLAKKYDRLTDFR